MTLGYQKYVIVSTYRSGTNLLTSLLNNHPRVISHHEIFRDNFLSNAQWLWIIVRMLDPVRFMKRYVYHPYPALISSVGFELQYDQARKGNQMNVWKYLQQQKDIKIIHLVRKNKLRTFLSYIVANKMHLWATARPNPLPQFSVELDVKECKEYFEKLDMYQSLIDRFFQSDRMVTITYEDLVIRQRGTLYKLQKFLGIPRLALVSRLKKQITQNLKVSIINYSQLKKEFSHTSWGIFFEDIIQDEDAIQRTKGAVGMRTIFIPSINPNNSGEIKTCNELIQRLAHKKNVTLIINTPSAWNRFLQAHVCKIVSTRTPQVMTSLISRSDIIIDINLNPAKNSSHKHIVETAGRLKKQILPPQEILRSL